MHEKLNTQKMTTTKIRKISELGKLVKDSWSETTQGPTTESDKKPAKLYQLVELALNDQLAVNSTP